MCAYNGRKLARWQDRDTRDERRCGQGERAGRRGVLQREAGRRDARVDPRLPAEAEREERLRVVLHVLYLIFNEGYTASSGRDLDRPDLAREAIRLARKAHAQLPDDSEVTGLLALMLLTHARREARTISDKAPPRAKNGPCNDSDFRGVSRLSRS